MNITTNQNTLNSATNSAYLTEPSAPPIDPLPIQELFVQATGAQTIAPPLTERGATETNSTPVPEPSAPPIEDAFPQVAVAQSVLEQGGNEINGVSLPQPSAPPIDPLPIQEPCFQASLDPIKKPTWNRKVVLKRILAVLVVLGLIAAAYFTCGAALIAIPAIKYCLVAWLGISAISGAYYATCSKEMTRDTGHNVKDAGYFLMDTALAPLTFLSHVGENLIGCWVR